MLVLLEDFKMLLNSINKIKTLSNFPMSCSHWLMLMIL